MVLTPSTTSGGIAGFTFWSMIWIALAEIDNLGKLFHLPKFISTKPVLRWIIEHKGISILCTELVNYGIHGIRSTTGVVFALGGTLCNAITIFFVLPVINRIKGPEWLYGDFRR